MEIIKTKATKIKPTAAAAKNWSWFSPMTVRKSIVLGSAIAVEISWESRT